MEKENTQKLLKWIYVLVALITLNIILTILYNTDGSSKNNTTNTTEKESSDDYDVSMFNSIDESGFMSLVKGDKAEVIYLGREGCGYCVQFLPVLQEAQEKIGYTTNYVDITAVNNESDDYTKMTELINGMVGSYNKENGTEYEYLYGYTPLILVVKDGKILDTWLGYAEYDKFAEWLNDNGIK